MNKYIITSPHFSGQVEATYIESELVLLDFRQSNIKGSFKNAFKSKLAVNEDGIGGCFDAKSVEIIKSEVEVSFEMFWDKYKKKVNQKRCIPLWNKLSKTDKVKAYLGIDKYFKWLGRPDNQWRSKLDPETYLRDRRWEDEY